MGEALIVPRDDVPKDPKRSFGEEALHREAGTRLEAMLPALAAFLGRDR